MAINVKTNPPLLRELRQMGLLSADAAPKLSGPFRLATEIFLGEGSGNTRALLQPVIAGGACSAYFIRLEGSSSRTYCQGNLTENTHYTVDGTTFTFLTNLTNKNVIISYAY